MAKLAFGEKFKKWDVKKQLEYLKDLAASQNEALDGMQKERDRLLVEVNFLKESAANAQAALDTQKAINKAVIMKSNSDMQEAGERVQELQKRLKVCG